MQIGILGLAGAGKDTAAQIISRITGLPIHRYADPLKVATRKVFGRNFDNRDVKEVPVPFYGHKIEDRAIEAAMDLCCDLGFQGAKADKFQELFFEVMCLPMMSPRQFQQLLGTDVCRAVDADCFIKTMPKVAVIPDVRFENELAYDLNILINRDVPSVSLHKSEAFVKEVLNDPTFYDDIVVVDNNGSMKDLETNLKGLL